MEKLTLIENHLRLNAADLCEEKLRFLLEKLSMGIFDEFLIVWQTKDGAMDYQYQARRPGDLLLMLKRFEQRLINEGQP